MVIGNSFFDKEVWHILPNYLSELGGSVEEGEIKNLLVSFNESPSRIERQKDVAVLHIEGILSPKPTLFDKWFNHVSTLDLMNDFQELVNDSAVRRIILYVDSPGGIGRGIEEFSNMIYEARSKKEIVSYVDNMAASAGYWIASSAENIIVEPFALIGSIGTYLSVFKNKENADYKVHYFSKGEKKLYGNPNIEMTSKEEQYFNELVDKANDSFVRGVARNLNVDGNKVKELEAEFFQAKGAPSFLYTLLGSFNETLS